MNFYFFFSKNQPDTCVCVYLNFLFVREKGLVIDFIKNERTNVDLLSWNYFFIAYDE